MGSGGEISARLKSDGTFDVRIMVYKVLACGPAGAGAFGSVPGNGSRTFSAKPNETVGIELPIGDSSWCRFSDVMKPPRATRQGVTVEGGRVTVSSSDFFRGQKTSILVSVTRRR
jgi:hypothetical protein